MADNPRRPREPAVRVALIHYWLVTMRGGEKVLEALCELFPQADIFTHVYDPAAVSERLRRRPVRTSRIGRLPGARRHYQKYLPLMPLALEELDLHGYDLVISSESGPAKGVIPPPGSLHICYCHTVMRYVWDMYAEYARAAGPLLRPAYRWLAHYLRIWDVTAAARVDHFICNSEHVRQRVRKYYRRDAEVIHPPVDTEAFSPIDQREDFYLLLGQLVPYKRPDLAVEACTAMKRRLVVIGEGERWRSLRRKAGATVTFLGSQPQQVVRQHLAACRALLFPGQEDFGIVPVEAMASGRPVIAYGAGGACETVVEGETGLFFYEQTPEALAEAIRRFEAMEERFDPACIVRRARRFDRATFRERMQEAVERQLERHRTGRGAGRFSALPASGAPPAPSAPGS